MSKKQQNSVLAADKTKKSSTTTATKPAVGGKSFRSDSWTYSDSQMVRDVHGERMTFGELKQRKAAGYYDTPKTQQTSKSSSSGSKKQAEREKAQKAAQEEQARQLAKQQEYQSLLNEVYADYRRSRMLLPEASAQRESGSLDSLFDQNDRAFRQLVEEEAREQERKTQKLMRQLDALSHNYEIPRGF